MKLLWNYEINAFSKSKLNKKSIKNNYISKLKRMPNEN